MSEIRATRVMRLNIALLYLGKPAFNQEVIIILW
ncbi:Uncharacterised protein [Mycobacterium tuberculosis]|uniref:Uncharacterized protein n=1 Tax=Mycobacterium tuberculosis TaxID=1773 RepID=A0A0T7PK66_MYCTX|nr:Uncharacterised protein [Mycobacterium tuberculosis]CFS31716.1 Uncharacterised protein [Mycobacterium tuberculosis]CKP58999.1 Uncharacterised protein [Mycobacterium tuberculosis]COW03102.1 Uncharacterised protein [Mycobacterium tuberculosis]COX25200.1 Uncharacterised protein [Mycobacterium tuberculosis]